MKLTLTELANQSFENGDELASELTVMLNEHIADYGDDFVQDMSHISQAAIYDGNILVDQVIFLKENLYRCDYSYDWVIGWTCSGTQEAGRVKEKVRFIVNDNGECEFKFLTLSA